MASPATDNIRVAIRVRPFIKRESDLQTHWKVDRNTMTQVSHGKLMSNSSYSFDRIFDVSNSTQDVYDDYGRPTVLSAMDGFNGTLFAYGQTSSGKTHTMMGDQRNEGVIPKAVGEIYDYIEKHPSREFLIRVSYMEIYNEDIQDLLNPAKTNLKIHENPQKQVYVGELTEEVVSCGEDVFKHMLRGEKNRHFAETNMNDRSSRSHTIFRVVIESREMMGEGKDADAIDGAVRVAHLNLVDLAGSERASQTGAVGQRLKEGGHINKSLLTLGTVIAKLSEGESFIPFRDSKLTRILQSSLGGNAKTSMICTITPAAVEETISTLKFACRAKTIKNCPEVNEVLDDGTLLKRYRKEICQLKKKLDEIGQQSTISQMQELQVEKEKMVEMLEQQRKQQSEQEDKIKRLRDMICSAGGVNQTKVNKARMSKRRETWCPGAALSKTPLASATALGNAFQTRLQRIGSSPSSEESEFDEMPRGAFLSILEEEEERKSIEFSQKRVGFVSPQIKRCLSPVMDTELEDKDMQTEPDEKMIKLQNEVKNLRKDLDEAVQTRDLYNELLEESNNLLEKKMSTESGFCPAPTSSDITLRYVTEIRNIRNEKANLETQVEVLRTQCQDLEELKTRNKELEDQVQSLESERTLSDEYASELQTEYESVQAEKQALAARVEGLENTSAFNTAAKMQLDSLQMTFEESEREKQQLQENLESWKQTCASLEGEVTRLQNELGCAANHKDTEALMALEESDREKQRLQENLESWKEKYASLEGEVTRLQNELSCTADEKDAEALVSAAKVEIDSLQMVLEENIREKEQLQENLESWKEKYASLEGEVTRLQNELSCTADEKDAEALVSAAKVEIDSLHMVLEENVREKEQLQEHLESWKEKYASLEGEVTRLQNELSCTADEKDAEALVSAAKVEIDSLQMVLEENVREKEQLQEHLESWKEKYASLEGEVTRLQNELGCTADERDAEALVSAAEVEIDSLQMVLEENVREKQQLQENLESWKEKYGSLEGEVARLQNELSCTADEKDAEALVSAAKVEIDSLQMVLEENVREKEQLQEHLESWKEKYASLEGEVTRLQNELSCTADEKDAEALVSAAKVEIDSLQMVLEENVREKQQLQENLESWKEKYGSLEGEVARLQNELSCTADEKDAEALVSAAKVEIDSLQMVLEENVREKEQLQEHLESWKEKYASLEGEVTRLQNELSCTADEKDAEALVSAAKVEIDSLQMVLEENVREKQQLQKNLESWKEKYASLEGEVTRLQNELSCTVDKKDAEALVSAAKVEIDSLQMVLEENVREKEQLQEHLESWKEKYGSLEGEVTRLQNELSCTADEKDAEALVSAAKVEIDSLQMVLEENVREKEQLQEHLESWKEKYASLEGEVTRLQNELSCTADEKDAEALVSAAKVEIDSLQMVLEENVREKQQLQEHLESWKEKYASLEGEVTRLQNELSCTADEKDAEALISAAKVEIDSLQMVLEENVREKEQLQENLESWKEKFSCLERDVAQLQDELTCAAAEKIQWEERMVCVKEDASVKAKELEDEIKRMEERLSSADEQEQMLTDVIEQKLQLEENIELLKAEQKKEISEEKCDIETRFEQFKAGKETEIAELLTKLEKVKQQLEEKPCEVQKKDAMVAQVIADERENLLNEVSQQKRAVEESFGVFKEEKETEIAKLMEEIKLLQTKLNEKTLSLKEKEKLLNDAVQQTCEFDTFKLEKETEVQKLSEGLRELEVHLHEKTNTVEEKENLLNEMIQLKCETEEKWKMFRQDKESEIERLTQQLHKNVTREDDLNQSLDSEDKQVMLLKAKVSDLKVQLEKTIDEKKELEHMLDRVKKERDEIKNDLSESITDTAELQKDVFDMQQKVKQYKEYIYELESELEQRVATIATCEQKIEYLQHQCTHKLTNEDLSEQNDDLASLQKDPAQEIAVECSALKSSLETAERANELLENEAQKIRHEADQLRGKVEDLEEQLVESEQACAISEQRLQVEQENCEKLIKEFDEYRLTDCRACKDLENQLAEIKQAGNVAAKQYEEERAKCTKLEIELEQLKSNVCRTKDSSGSVPFELELQKAKKESEELVKYFTDEKKAHEMLRKEHSSLSEELQYLRDSLLRDTNRGMDQQRVIDKMKTERRETICVQAHQRQELEKDLCEAEKKVTELESHCTLLKSGKDVLEHRLEVANKKLEETKQEMRDTENLFSSHNTRAVTQLDDNKALQKLKQMAFSVDLTKQKCEKAEARVKELENENRQLRGAEIRNGALLEERDNLKQQVQQAKQALDEKSRKLNQFSIEVTQLRAHVDKLSEENKKNRSSLEKKEDKIDNLEQKLWDTEEELKLERQRFHEQQSRGPILEELNSTIQVKHEELEHMTFLVDEKDIEIAEVRCSLQENETKQEEMVGTLQRKEERLDELENELEHANKNTLVARAGCEEAEVKIEELKAIIKQQESEMILINEKIESGKTESEIQSQELGSKTQLLENELQDMEHKLLEVESELEFTKTSCEKATAEKQELVDVLGAYGEAFNNNSSAEDLNVDVEFLKAQLGPNLEQISSVLNRTNEVENINNKLKEALEGRVLLEEKLAELQTSFKGEQSALEEEIDELRESVLNEKKLVFELEDKVNIAVNGKNAMEAELRRVLLEKEASVAKDDVDMKIAAIANSESEMRRDLEEAKERVMQFEGEIARLTEEKDKWENILTSETELRRQLETQKELNIQLEDEARKLKEEIATWESQAETKSMVPEENPWEEEMARITERYEEEKQQLLDQLREISALKVKESEDIYSEKEEKIEELESKLATVTKTAVDYERAVEHYQLKLAKVEYELDTTVERLEKQSSTSTVDNREMETLKKECEVAKKNCKDAQEKYFSESDRLKAIIDEQEDELDALKAELKKMSEASQNPVANSEMESLRKECEVAKKRCKEAQEKYFSESDRLKAIIDEQEDELDALKAELKKTSEASQNSSKPVANSEMESLRKECEVAKKQCKDAQEKYFSESDRLKAIIDEQEDELDALKAELKKMSEASQNSSNAVANSEMESLRKECEVAKKRCKEAQEKYFSESDRLKAIIDEMQDEQEEYVRQMNELKTKTVQKEAEMCQMRNELAEMKRKAQGATKSTSYTENSEMETLKKECEVAKRKCKEAQEKYFSESDRLKAIIDEQEGELDAVKAELKKMSEASQNSSNPVANSEMESLRKECEVAKKRCKEAQEKYFSESDRLKAIIDEMQDEQEEYVRQMNELKTKTAQKEAEMCQIRNQLAEMKRKAQGATVQNGACSVDSMECLKRKFEAANKKAEEKYASESDRLKAIIHEQQEIIEKSRNEEDTDEELKTTRIDLAQKNMQIQSLQYDLYKLQENYNKDTRALSKEVEWGRDKVGSLKIEIRRLKENEPEDTISFIRGQPVAAKKKESSDVGVVSTVAIYSLKAKVGKLESETERLNEKVQQLQKEKATFSLLNTEASNKVAQLTSENKALKTHKKKLMEEAQKLKANEGDSKPKVDSGRRLPEVSTEALERESRNSTILSLSCVENVSLPTAEYKRSKPESKPKQNFQNWLSEDAADNMFKDEPNQCANQ